jgi:hypothetical protein
MQLTGQEQNKCATLFLKRLNNILAHTAQSWGIASRYCISASSAKQQLKSKDCSLIVTAA